LLGSGSIHRAGDGCCARHAGHPPGQGRRAVPAIGPGASRPVPPMGPPGMPGPPAIHPRARPAHPSPWSHPGTGSAPTGTGSHPGARRRPAHGPPGTLTDSRSRSTQAGPRPHSGTGCGAAQAPTSTRTPPDRRDHTEQHSTQGQQRDDTTRRLVHGKSSQRDEGRTRFHL
jgi:hypothetical protein